MNGKPVVVLCGNARCMNGSLDLGKLSASIANSDAIDRLVILDEPCRAPSEALSAIRKRKVIFAGCPLLNESGFYEHTARRLVIGSADWLAMDLRADVLDLYEKSGGVEETVRAVLESAAQRLTGAQPVGGARVVAPRRVLVYGSGLSGLTAALELAAEGISVDVLDTEGQPVSPGCLGETLHEPDLVEMLEEKTRRSDRILFLQVAGRTTPVPIDGGFFLPSRGGDTREYGSIVFAPERVEEPPEDAGAFTLTRLFGFIRTGKAVAGRVVVLLDRNGETDPEVFHDVLLAAGHLTKRMQAHVIVLARNARVSLPGAQELYDECREMGILFIRYRDAVSITSGYGDFVLRGVDDHTGSGFLIEKPKILVIPGRTRLPAEAAEFARSLGLRLSGNRYTQPGSLWRSVNETNRGGVFAAGAARGNMTAEGVRNDAASLAHAIRERLSPQGIRIEEHIPVVDKKRCAYCLTCVRLCPFGAMERDPVERAAKVCASACKGCGLCAAECPAQAIEVRNLGSVQVRAGVRALVR